MEPDLAINVAEAQVAYRSVFIVEMLLRLLARALISRSGSSIRQLCEQALGRRGHHPVPLPSIVDDGLLSAVDELNHCTLGELTKIVFDTPELQPRLKEWLQGADANQLRTYIQLVLQLRNALAHFWPLRFTADLTAPLRISSAVLVTVLTYAGVENSEFQQLKRLQRADTDSGSSRRLDFARQGMAEPAVVTAVAEHLTHPGPETPAALELANLLSYHLRLRPAITFRASTTQVFRAALECVALHSLGHPPRPGEEGVVAARLIAPHIHGSHPLGKAVYSDVDHPAMQYTVQAMWTAAGGGSGRITLSDLLFSRDRSNDPRAAVVQRYREAVSAGGVSVVLVPHVVWINGAVLDVRQICSAIREIDPLVVTVVDGAQAVGHIPLEVEDTPTENEDIDFYLGCGQKWLAGPEAVGFGRIGRRFERECLHCLEVLASGEVVTDASGLGLRYTGAQTATQLRGLARGLVEALHLRRSGPGGFEGSYIAIRNAADRIREALQSVEQIELMEPPLPMRSGIVSLTGSARHLRSLHDSLAAGGYHAAVYPLPAELRRTFTGREFVRLSPGAGLTAEDMAPLQALLRSAP